MSGAPLFLQIVRDTGGLPERKRVNDEGWMDLGTSPTALIRLESNFIAPQHARISRIESGVRVECVEGSSIRVGQRSIAAGESAVLRSGESIRIADFNITLVAAAVEVVSGGDALVERYSRHVERVHAAAVDALYRDRGERSAAASIPRAEVEELVGRLLRKEELAPDDDVSRVAVERLLLDAIAERVLLPREAAAPVDALFEPALAVISGRLSLGGRNIESALDHLRRAGPGEVGHTWAGLPPGLRRAMAIAHILEAVTDQIHAYGPLTRYLRWPDIEEIMVVSPRDIYIARGGALLPTGRAFVSAAACEATLERLVLPAGRRIDRSSPLVDVRLPDGSRVNAVIPPLAVLGPCITIRRFPQRVLALDDLVQRFHTLDEQAALFLRACVQARLSVVISGGTASGKTSLLGALAAFIGPHERVVTIEDTAELRLPLSHVVTLQAAPANAEGVGAVSTHDLMRNSLRMRPDRIIVGEVRDATAFDMIQAMSTGHEGSMTTLHANSAREAIARLLAMMAHARLADDHLMRFQLGHALQVIVQIQRLEDGRRRVVEIHEVAGFDDRRGDVILEPIYRWSSREDRLRYTGYVPRFIDRVLERTGIEPAELLAWS